MSFTYDSLKQAIQDYTENSETTFVNNLPIFIRASEERILKNVQLNLFMRNQVGLWLLVISILVRLVIFSTVFLTFLTVLEMIRKNI